MGHVGEVGTEIAPAIPDDPALASRIDDLLHRTCHLARALTGAEQAALKVDLDGDDAAARKFFNLSDRYERWRDYRRDPRGFGLHSMALEPGEVVRLLQLSDKAGGANFTEQDADNIRDLAAFAGATLDALRAARGGSTAP